MPSSRSPSFLLSALLLILGQSVGFSTDRDDLRVLVDGDASRQTYAARDVQKETRYHVAGGVSYTGFELRYQFSSRWAAEARYQFGKADSNYGKVRASVVGLRGYRFVPYRKKLSWYFGGEVAHADAKTENSSYATDGVAIGAFGGLEYRLLPRLAIGADIGPYVISLKEKQTHQSQTNLDFIINTALNFYLF